MPQLGGRAGSANLIAATSSNTSEMSCSARSGLSTPRTRANSSSLSWLDRLARANISDVGAPLFDIVMAGVRPREMGSASGVLQTVNSLGMSLGIAGIGAIFFALAGGHFLHAKSARSGLA